MIYIVWNSRKAQDKAKYLLNVEDYSASTLARSKSAEAKTWLQWESERLASNHFPALNSIVIVNTNVNYYDLISLRNSKALQWSSSS